MKENNHNVLNEITVETYLNASLNDKLLYKEITPFFPPSGPAQRLAQGPTPKANS